jgi:hypothetical protein
MEGVRARLVWPLLSFSGVGAVAVGFCPVWLEELLLAERLQSTLGLRGEAHMLEQEHQQRQQQS